MSSEEQKIFDDYYRAGREALENGQYRLSIEYLEKADSLKVSSLRSQTDVKMWLVTAYQAAGNVEEACTLCEELTRHPNADTRKKAQDLLYILKAPRLERPANWLSQIPSIENVAEGSSQYLAAKSSQKMPTQPPAIADTSKESSKQENTFIWVALVAVVLILLMTISLS